VGAMDLAPFLPSIPFPNNKKFMNSKPSSTPVPGLAKGHGNVATITAQSTQEPSFQTLCGDNLHINFKTLDYCSMLQECTDTKQLEQLHAEILKNALYRNKFFTTKLVGLYAMLGSMEDARKVFDRIRKRDVFLWNVMIRGYAKKGPYEEAIALYAQMQEAGMKPNNFTFSCVLTACACLLALEQGKWVHDDITRADSEFDVYVANALLNMYCKCGSLEDARQVFDKMSERDVVSWNAMIVGHAQNGCAGEALRFLSKMRTENIMPNSATMVSVLPACAQLAALQQGKCIHAYIIRVGFDLDVVVVTSLVDMYAKCGSVEIACRLFEKMGRRDLVSWNAMISGYVQNGYSGKVLALFKQMQQTGTRPDTFTVVSVLTACAYLGSLQQGKWIHGYVIRRGFELNVFVGTALIDMYAKCGGLEFASEVFDKMSGRDLFAWNAIIAAYGRHGHGEAALAVFSRMLETGLRPNHITFTHVLSACSHAGLIDKGWHYFNLMSRDYCITPRLEHYACIVDLLGRAGHLDEAIDFIKKMPLQPDAIVWGALLAACRIHCNIELGQNVAEHLFELEPENAGWHVLLSNIYAASGRWDDVAKVRTIMKDGQLKKTPGCSVIELDNTVHAFYVGDRSHPQSENIYAMLDTLSELMKEAGYVPYTDFVLHDVEEEVKEYMLSSHSEKLAIAFGILSTNPGIPVQIMKNLRVCGDCHNATKFISKIVQREVVVRDANRFHHFKNGLCSCGDFW